MKAVEQLAKKYCAGVNNDHTIYGYSQKVVAGKVAGLKLSEGSRSTRDLKEPMKGPSPNVSSKFGVNYYDLPNQGMR